MFGDGTSSPTPGQFFQAVHGNSPGVAYTFRHPKDGFLAQPILAADSSTLAAKAEAVPDLFFHTGTVDVGLVPQIAKRHGRPRESEITSISSLWIDLDVAEASKDGHNYPPREKAMEALLADPLVASIVVNSKGSNPSSGLHGYVLLDQPFIIRNDDDRAFAKALVQRYQHHIRGKLDGFEVDSTADLARVLRCPGSRRAGGEVVSVDRWCPAWQYSAELLDEFLPPLPTPRKNDLDTLGTVHGDVGPADKLGQATRWIADQPGAVDGEGGHNATFAVACGLVLGFDLPGGEALRLLTVWNSTCSPPWSPGELEHKISDAAAKDRQRGYLLAQYRKDTPDDGKNDALRKGAQLSEGLVRPSNPRRPMYCPDSWGQFVEGIENPAQAGYILHACKDRRCPVCGSNWIGDFSWRGSFAVEQWSATYSATMDLAAWRLIQPQLRDGHKRDGQQFDWIQMPVACGLTTIISDRPILPDQQPVALEEAQGDWKAACLQHPTTRGTARATASRVPGSTRTWLAADDPLEKRFKRIEGTDQKYWITPEAIHRAARKLGYKVSAESRSLMLIHGLETPDQRAEFFDLAGQLQTATDANWKRTADEFIDRRRKRKQKAQGVPTAVAV